MTTEINRRRREGGTLYLLKNLKGTYYMGYDPVAKKVTTTKDPYKAYPFLNEGSCKAFLGHIQNGMNKMHTYKVSGFRFEGIEVQADQPFGSFFKKYAPVPYPEETKEPKQILNVAEGKQCIVSPSGMVESLVGLEKSVQDERYRRLAYDILHSKY